MADVSSRNLQVRLLILVFLAFVPAMGIFWYANRELTELQLAAKEEELSRRAEVVVTEYRTLLNQSRAFLGALSEIPDIQTTRFPECTERLERVLRHSDAYTTISVIGMDGYLACGALTPETPLYLRDRLYFTRATARDTFSVGELALGRITGKPVVGMAIPLHRGDQMSGVLGTSLDLNVLSKRYSETPLPEGYTFSILDKNRRVLVRVPLAGDFTLADSVGSVAAETFPGLPAGSHPVIVTGIDLDGMERLFAVAALPGLSGQPIGYLAFGRTRLTLMEEVDRIVNLQLRFLAVGGVVLLVLAWVLGHFWLARRMPEPDQA